MTIDEERRWQFPGGDTYTLPAHIEDARNLVHAGDTQLHIETPSGTRQQIWPGQWVEVGPDHLLRVIPTPTETSDGR